MNEQLEDGDLGGRRTEAGDGAQAHSVLRPDEFLMMCEEGAEDEEAGGLLDVVEVFRQVLCFVFFDRRSHERMGWDYGAAAVEVLFREFAPSMWMAWGVDGSARRKGVGLVCGAGAGVHEFLSRAEPETVERVLAVVGGGVGGRLWMVELTQRFYGLAKLVDESLIGHASLAHLGEIFGEGNGKASRARWSARVKQLQVALAGGEVVHGRYQKCDEARERMSKAQRGNCNRRKKLKG